MFDSHCALVGLGCASELLVVGLDGVVYTDKRWAAGAWPSLPMYRGGNFVVFSAAPKAADLNAWDAVYAAHFERSAALSHRTYGWSLSRHGPGARDVFVQEGFTPEHTRVFAGSHVDFPEGGNRDVQLRALRSDADWDAALDGQMDNYDAPSPEDHVFQASLMLRYRAMSEAGHGHWYGAFLGKEMVASCGAFKSKGSPARFQSVVTRRAHRRQGAAAALVALASDMLLSEGAPSVIITAAADSSAERIYRSLGLALVDEMCTLLHRPTHDDAEES